MLRMQFLLVHEVSFKVLSFSSLFFQFDFFSILKGEKRTDNRNMMETVSYITVKLKIQKQDKAFVIGSG